MPARSDFLGDRIKEELKRLRKWQALAHPTTVLQLSPELRAKLAGDFDGRDRAREAVDLMTALTKVIDGLSPHDRLYAQVDFNLVPDHSYPTLTERQESLAGDLKCATKTIRRRSSRALETMALVIASGGELHPSPGYRHQLPASAPADHAQTPPLTLATWRQEIGNFWKLSPDSRVDIVCSELPEDERPYFASSSDRNYLRYARFADLDSLIYLRTRLIQSSPELTVRDFVPAEYSDGESDVLIIIGGPPWNTKYREFLTQLPFYFEPHRLGEDDPLIVPHMNDLRLAPRWTARNELLEDLAVFTRLTLGQGTAVFLLGGCLTLGVLGAAKCFLEREAGAHNARLITELVGDKDVVVVTEARRIGGITDTPDLNAVPPLLVLARSPTGAFTTVLDNTARYLA